MKKTLQKLPSLSTTTKAWHSDKNKNKIKIFLLKIAWFLAVMIWNIILFFKWNKNIDLKTIKKIIFNRKDRIWDAVITKPFIILFSKYIKKELKLNIEIEIECSKYNEFVFNERNCEDYYKIIAMDREISWTGMELWNFIVNYIRLWFLWIKKKLGSKKIRKNWVVYIDLIWDIESIMHKINKWYYFIWGNMLMNNHLLDYSLSNNYVSWCSKNLIKSYIDLVSWCFKLNNFEKYINDNIEEFYSEYNHSNNKSWILVSMGNKEYRNLDIKIWETLVKCLSKKYPNKEIKVIDDHTNTLYNKLREIKDFSDNVEIVKNNFSLKEFRDYAKNFELLIWIDGWWFNYIRTCSDSITIYTIGNHNVRSIFTWNNKYEGISLGNNWFLNSVNIWKKRFWYIYKKEWLLPTYYDIEVSKKIFQDFPINKLLTMSENLFSK